MRVFQGVRMQLALKKNQMCYQVSYQVIHITALSQSLVNPVCYSRTRAVQASFTKSGDLGEHISANGNLTIPFRSNASALSYWRRPKKDRARAAKG
jgi:hypothetical protein